MKFVKRAFQTNITKTNISVLFMEKLKIWNAMFAARHLEKIKNSGNILKIITRKKTNNVNFVPKDLLILGD